VGGRKSPFPITLAIGLYNSLYYRTNRDMVGIEAESMWFRIAVVCLFFRQSRINILPGGVYTVNSAKKALCLLTAESLYSQKDRQRDEKVVLVRNVAFAN